MESPRQQSFNSVAFETLARDWSRNLRRGVTPTIDLSPYGYFDIAAVGEMLAFWISVQEGTLGKGKRPPEFVLPKDQRAERFLLKLKPFQFAVSMGGVFWGIQELATYEQEINAEEARVHHNFYPYMPISHVVKRTVGEKRREFFEGQCYKLLNNISEQFNLSLHESLGFDHDSVATFWQSNKELLENVYFHSDSWGFAAIQTSQRGVVIFYADIGIGILRSLEPQRDIVVAKTRKAWSEATAIEGSFMRGITGKPGKSHGDGLDLVKTYVQQHNGNVVCRSGSTKVSFQANGRVYVSAVEYVPGVQIRIDLPTKQSS